MLDLRKFIVIVLIPSLMFVNLPFLAFADSDTGGPSLRIEHSPVSTLEAGKVFSVSANLQDREGIELVRLYFRAVGTKPYYFVPMIVTKGTEYFGMIPAPSSSTSKIEYQFLVKTYNNRIFNSETFTVNVFSPDQIVAMAEQDTIDVLTETKDVPEQMAGFVGKTRVRLVTKHEKHGVLAGLYTHEESGGTASNGRYHGTVLRSGTSSRNMYLIAGGVALGAVAIGLAAGSGSGGGSSSSSTPPPTTVVDSTGAGTWTLEFNYSPCFKTTTQTVECSAEGLVTSVSPTAIGIPLPADCANTPFNGLSDIFVVGGSCDTMTACNNYSSPDLASKTCADNSMIFTKQAGSRVERWTVQ